MQIRSRGKPGSRSSRSVVIVLTLDRQRHLEAGYALEFRQSTMRQLLLSLLPLLFLLSEIKAAGIGKAWQVPPYSTDYWNHPSWPRLDSSAFEVRSVSGVGHLTPLENPQRTQNPVEPNTVLTSSPRTLSQKSSDHYEPVFRDFHSHDHYQNGADIDGADIAQKFLRPQSLMMKILQSKDLVDFSKQTSKEETKKTIPRIRRDTENETKLEQITTVKNVREARLGSPEAWSSQPLAIEFPHGSALDQMIQQTSDDGELPNARGFQAPRADFVTSHQRRSYEHREARDMPAVTRGYDDYDSPWYRNSVRDRDYDPLTYRRGYSYYYPDRYRTERDYYSMRVPTDYSYYYDRYRDEDLDLYGRSRPTPKPKRIIYYATLPEVVRKPVDLRNYPRPYDGTRSQVSRDGTFKRIPGNVDPSRYRYRHLYDGYDSYSKRFSFVDRPYGYSDEDGKRNRVTLENFRNSEGFDQNNERKLANQISVRNEGKLPWPVQVGTEVSVKDDERIPGRKIFGEGNGFERFQNAQIQKAPDATGSSELQSDN